MRSLLFLVTVLVCSPAMAQHANFVLAGESNPDGLALPEERQAVHPVTSPYYNEDSFVTSDIRAWYLFHSFPGASPLAGGDIQIFALQVRLALTDKLQLVAYKDGYSVIDSGLVENEGLNDVAAGLKYNFLQDWENDMHAAVGLGYQIGVGDSEALQDDDELRLWASVNKGYDKLHVGGTVNLLVPTDNEDALGDSTRLFWNAHADYYVCEWFSPVLEFNGYHTLEDGDNAPLPVSGLDAASLGGGEGEDVITLGLGGEVRPADNLGLRVAWETPLTDNNDIFNYRWTFSAVFDF